MARIITNPGFQEWLVIPLVGNFGDERLVLPSTLTMEEAGKQGRERFGSPVEVMPRPIDDALEFH